MANLIPIDILGHADRGGSLRENRRVTGFARFGTQIDKIREHNPEGTLLLDAGDEFSARFWPGLPIVEALALHKTDAMTLGNHEFDHGREFIEECIAHAQYPILCANITEKATGKLVKGVLPWIMLERRGIKIGVLGLTTEYTPYMVTGPMFAPYEIHPCVPVAQKYIPEMRAAGAQIVVVLSHFPFYVDENGNISGELWDVLSAIPHVDCFIGGHIPGDYGDIVLDTAVLKGGFSKGSLPHARLWFDPERGEVVRKQAWVDQTPRTGDVNPVYQAYADKVVGPHKEWFATCLATAEEDWVMRLSEECKLGNLLADCMLEAAGAEMAYMNATSAGGSLVAGPVTIEDVVDISGFNDPIYTSQLSGKQIWELFDLVFVPERYGNNAGILFSGIVVHVDHTKPAWQKVQAITLRDGTPLEMERLYTVATSEYMAHGGNDTGPVAHQVVWNKTETRFWDAIFDYLRKNGVKLITADKRMHEIGRPENNNAPF